MQLKSNVTQRELYYVALALLIVATAIIWRWMRSPYGLALTAVRDDEDAARSSGVDTGRVKAAVFLVSGALTGLASGLYFMDVVIITPPSAFTIAWASTIVFVVVAGGMGTVAGPIVGAVVFIVVDRIVGAAAGQGLLVLGALSIVLMLVLPRGLMGIVHDLRFPDRRRRGPTALAQWRRWLLGDNAASDRAALVDQPGVVGAWLVPSSPLLVLRRDEPRYAELVAAMQRVAGDIERLEPDTVVVYSTRWIAVLDQLWQGRARMTGLQVDDNWHALGEVRFDMTSDVSLARACVRAAQRAGIASKLVDYAGFPLDAGTLTATMLADPEGTWPKLVIANNVYHDFARTRTLGELTAAQAAQQGKRVVVLAVGGLSAVNSRRARLRRRPDRHVDRRRLEPAHAQAAREPRCRRAAAPVARLLPRSQGRHGLQALRLRPRRDGRTHWRQCRGVCLRAAVRQRRGRRQAVVRTPGCGSTTMEEAGTSMSKKTSTKAKLKPTAHTQTMTTTNMDMKTNVSSRRDHDHR